MEKEQEQDRIHHYGEGCVEMNITAIARGMREMIRDSEYETALAFGMMPGSVFEAFRKEIDRKFPTCPMLLFEKEHKILEEKEIIEMKRRMEHEVSLELLRLAKEERLLIV